MIVTSEDEEKVYEILLHRIVTQINTRALIGTVGAMRTNGEAIQKYYLVKWITEPYTVHENTAIKEVESQHTTFSGEIIYDAVFWNLIPNAVD